MLCASLILHSTQIGNGRWNTRGGNSFLAVPYELFSIHSKCGTTVPKIPVCDNKIPPNRNRLSKSTVFNNRPNKSMLFNNRPTATNDS